MQLLDAYGTQIRSLCEHHKVKSLYAFGSVNTPRFNDESDIDLLVDFQIEDPIEYTDNYFDLKFNLEKIFNRPIDLLESRSVRNPYLKESIDKTKVLVYGK
ncbi:MAG: nucleotidyltransferase family protein [Bacteroidota bacterium]